eukprot:CAMPEP_0198604930 /NCGR_PEP_ID=MMETSP1462-20131121/153820_1 /TAXON_ID=1333877 /ORGANISM="Brandtodinium nutriculum, Strain RCC3387" /LENGTH=291 /DNA_ID=CAMNT_0044336723 /DNA_START=24 /DNA_END=900 /DNA_ORIENTATION=-
MTSGLIAKITLPVVDHAESEPWIVQSSQANAFDIAEWDLSSDVPCVQEFELSLRGITSGWNFVHTNVRHAGGCELLPSLCQFRRLPSLDPIRRQLLLIPFNAVLYFRLPVIRMDEMIQRTTVLPIMTLYQALSIVGIIPCFADLADWDPDLLAPIPLLRLLLRDHPRGLGQDVRLAEPRRFPTGHRPHGLDGEPADLASLPHFFAGRPDDDELVIDVAFGPARGVQRDRPLRERRRAHRRPGERAPTAELRNGPCDPDAAAKFRPLRRHRQGHSLLLLGRRRARSGALLAA